MCAITEGPIAPQASWRGPGWPMCSVMAHLKTPNLDMDQLPAAR